MTTTRPNRIVDHLVVKGRDLLPNPANWRTHPPQQREATRAALDRLGYVDELKVVQTPEGLLLLDGHMRAEIGEDDDIPVAVVDLDEEEQRIMLATFDPITSMAYADLEAYARLGVLTDDDGLQALIDAVAAGEYVPLLAEDGVLGGGWSPTEDTSRGTAVETVGYDLTSVWPATGDEDTRVWKHLKALPRDPTEDPQDLRLKFSRSPALEMERIVRTYMRPGDVFLEVCAGWWTFSMTAALWGYSGEGVDIWPQSLAFGRSQKRRLRNIEGAGTYKVVDADALALPYPDSHFDLVYCNPPFFQLEQYSDDDRDLARRPTVEEWLADSGKMMAEMRRVVKPTGLVVTVMADYRNSKAVLQPLHGHWVTEGINQGLVLHDLVVQAMRTEQVRMWRMAFDRRRTLKAQEYVIVFSPGKSTDPDG